MPIDTDFVIPDDVDESRIVDIVVPVYDVKNKSFVSE